VKTQGSISLSKIRGLQRALRIRSGALNPTERLMLTAIADGKVLCLGIDPLCMAAPVGIGFAVAGVGEGTVVAVHVLADLVRAGLVVAEANQPMRLVVPPEWS
jgi:hypothetical protein